MNRLLRIFTAFLALFALAAGLSAQDMAAVQKRMQARTGAIDTLKQQGLVGEDNRGFLDARGSLNTEQGSVLSEENSDRSTVYSELAKRNNTTADNVGKLRAKKIAENSSSGIWLQDESGKWYKK